MIRRQGSSRRRAFAAVAIAGVLLIVVVVIAWPVRGGSEPEAGATPTGSPTATSSAGRPTAVPSPSLGTPSAVGSGAPEPVEPVKTKKAVPLDKTGDFGTGLTVRLSRIAAVKGRATAPGEIAGPAIKITVTARNRTDRALRAEQRRRLRFFRHEPYASQRTQRRRPAADGPPRAGHVGDRHVPLHSARAGAQEGARRDQLLQQGAYRRLRGSS